MRRAFRSETNFWILDFMLSLVIKGGDVRFFCSDADVVVEEGELVTTGSIVIPRLRRTIRSNCASRSKRSLEFSVHSAIRGDCVGTVENEEGDAASGIVEARRSASKDEDRRLGDDSTDKEE